MKSAIPRIPQETRLDCLQLYIIGFEPFEIGQRTGINENTIRGWVMKEKWNDRRKKHEQLNLEKHPIEERPLIKAFAKEKGNLKKQFVEKAGEMAVKDMEYWADTLGPEDRLEVATNIAALNGAHRKNLSLDEEAEGDKSHISLTFLTRANEEGFVRVLEPEKVKQIENHAEPTAE